MTLSQIIDFIFPYVESPTEEQLRIDDEKLTNDIVAIHRVIFNKEQERALDEAQRVMVFERERMKTADSKATTYLAVLAFLVPLVITLQTAVWEHKASHAPALLKIALLFLAAVYLIATSYHALLTLKVSAFQRVMEDDIINAWRTSLPLQKLTRCTLLASRNSRKAVNNKVTHIKVAHLHLVRAFSVLLLLMLLEPVCYVKDLIMHTSAKVEPVKKDIIIYLVPRKFNQTVLSQITF